MNATYYHIDLSFFPYELHCVKDESIIATISASGNSRKVQIDLDETFGNLMSQEDKERTKKADAGDENEFDKYVDMEQLLQEEDEYADANDYVESYFDNGEGDDLDDDG
ncbi:17051_t:CDS:2, partial [Acaulospora colombiana]